MLNKAKSASGGKITILGSGYTAPTKKRFPSSYLLELDEEKYLIDCGHGALVRLAEKGIGFEDIEAVFISHFHADHVSNLIPLMQAIHVQGIFYPEKLREKDIIVFGPKRTKKLIAAVRDFMFPEKKEPFKIKIVELGKDKVNINKLIVSSLNVDHSKEYLKYCLAYRFDKNDKSVVYSGDIDWTENIEDFVDFAKGCDVLVVDASKPIGWGRGAHLEPFQIAQIAAKIKPKILVPTHLTGVNTPSEIKKAIEEFYAGDIRIAEDGMEIEI